MYGYNKKVDLEFNEATEKVKDELKKEGFGILTEIDVKETLRKKLDVNFEDYVILGACNPSLAFEALKAEQEIGLLLPCNVIVYRSNGQTHVSAILPTQAMSMVENPKLMGIAKKVEEKLKKAVDNI